MLKIAFITHHVHTKTGGVSTYNRILFNHWNNIHSITEFPIYKTKKEQMNQRKIDNIQYNDVLCAKNTNTFLGPSTYNKQSMKRIYSDFDIVIISAIEFPKKWINHRKSLMVQHHNFNYYSFIGKFQMDTLVPFGFLFGSLLFGLGTVRNGLRRASNVVFFTEETSRKIKGNSFYIPLSPFKREDMKISNNIPIQTTWMARFNRQKNPLDAVKIANINNSLMIYGSGKTENLILNKLSNKNQFGGHVLMDDRLELYKKTRVFIITSKLEGFVYTAAESLSFGVPVIMYDSFDGAKYYDKCDAVFLVKNGDWKAVNQKILEINTMSDLEYNTLRSNALKFAQERLTLENFVNKWDQVVAKLDN